MEINGLPVHVLVVHAVVVLVPTAAAAVAASAWSARLRRRLGLLPVALCLAGLVLTPLTVEAGEDLRSRLPASPLIARHAEQGGRMLAWVIALLLASVAVHVVGRRAPRPARDDRASSPRLGRAGTTTGSTAVHLLVAVLATAVAVGATVQTVRTGESGARAVWEGAV